MFEKVISGGQTGVDRAALDVALELGDGPLDDLGGVRLLEHRVKRVEIEGRGVGGGGAGHLRSANRD